jgi:imidazolonepropionase-like amidohydrolase
MPRTLFSGGSVFDAVSATVGAADVVIEDGLVREVGPGLDGDTEVDVTGRVVLPGLMDAHVHLCFSHLDSGRALFEPFSLRWFQAAANLRATLAVGITTVRDAGYSDDGVKQAVELGLVPGPRVRIAVGMVSQTGGHADEWLPSGTTEATHPGIPATLVDGRDSARRVVRSLVRAGADQIKVATTGGGLSAHTDPHRSQLRDDELAEIVAEAAAAGRDVMAHSHAASGVVAAVRAGVRSIEHGTLLTEEAVALMAERGTYLVPTLSAPYGVLDSAAEGVSLPTGSEAKARELIDHHGASFRLALDAGVPIAMGTDAPVWPHGRNLEELGRMADAGMAPLETWRSTTLVAARLMRLDDELGSLEPGKRADLVVLAGDPEDLTGLADRVEQVWKDGVRCR